MWSRGWWWFGGDAPEAEHFFKHQEGYPATNHSLQHTLYQNMSVTSPAGGCSPSAQERNEQIDSMVHHILSSFFSVNLN